MWGPAPPLIDSAALHLFVLDSNSIPYVPLSPTFPSHHTDLLQGQELFIQMRNVPLNKNLDNCFEVSLSILHLGGQLQTAKFQMHWNIL
jgi:hypothetical protein